MGKEDQVKEFTYTLSKTIKDAMGREFVLYRFVVKDNYILFKYKGKKNASTDLHTDIQEG